MLSAIKKLRVGHRVSLIEPSIHQMNEFLEKANASKTLHGLWTQPPRDKEAYLVYLDRYKKSNQASFFVTLNDSNELIGVININEIVRGALSSGYVGYYVFSGFEQQGLMREGLTLLIEHAFSTMASARSTYST